jgi:ABC-type oligopeptide transport system ATPase subunit
MGPTESVVTNPLHPYSQLLLQAVEELAPSEAGQSARGPDLTHPGDHAIAKENHATIEPKLQEVTPGHYVARPSSGQPEPDETTEKEE